MHHVFEMFNYDLSLSSHFALCFSDDTRQDTEYNTALTDTRISETNSQNTFIFQHIHSCYYCFIIFLGITYYLSTDYAYKVLYVSLTTVHLHTI
jgi:hypothetical protein